MLQFLYPIGLLAAIGIIIPIVIHLWNIKSGKTLKIGSISLLGAASNQRASHLKISDWPLLLLRCLILFLLAALLAKPIYQSVTVAAEEPGWVLIPKQELNKVWNAEKKQIDSLLKKGYELRDFNIGFSKIELRDTSANFSRPAQLPPSYFSLIRQLDVEKANGTSVYLYTNNQLKRFEGAQPYTHVNLKWKTFAATNPVKSVSRLDTAKLQVQIYTNGLAVDAAYLKAAVAAIDEFTKRKIAVKEIQSFQQINSSTNLVFWLSEKPLPAQLWKQLPAGISFFSYAGTKPIATRSVIHYERGSAPAEIALYQRRKFNGSPQQAMWTDGFGVPLLTLDYSSVKHYQFYSRFNQGWTDLVWNSGLVEALLPLVIPHQETEFGFTDHGSSVKTISALPMPIPAAKTAGLAKFYTQQSLSVLIWWLLVLTFFIERWVTYQKTARKS